MKPNNSDKDKKPLEPEDFIDLDDDTPYGLAFEVWGDE